MKLGDVATVRIGLVASRKKAEMPDKNAYKYKLLNLKSVSDSGTLNTNLLEPYSSKERLKMDYLTQIGDILIRLSVPYTVLMITKDEHSGLVIPSHFSIIRVDLNKAYPEYICWILCRDSTKKKIAQNNSGSSSFGTISSGFFSELPIRDLPMQKQIAIGQCFVLSSKEQQLLANLIEQKALLGKAITTRIYSDARRGKHQ